MTRYVRSVERAIAVLEFLGGHGSPAGLGEIRVATRTPKSTALNIVRTLAAKNMLTVDSVTKRYSLGSLLTSLAGQAKQQLDLRTIARPHLEQLARITEEGVFLSTLEGEEIVYIEKVDSTQAIRYTAHVGTRRPLHCTSAGKVALAMSPRAFVNRYIRETGLQKYTKATIASPKQLREELARVRMRGYAVTVAEYIPDLMGVAAPVTDGEGRFLAAVTLVGPAFRMRKRQAGIRDAVLGATRAIAAAYAGAGDVGAAARSLGDGRGPAPRGTGGMRARQARRGFTAQLGAGRAR